MMFENVPAKPDPHLAPASWKLEGAPNVRTQQRNKQTIERLQCWLMYRAEVVGRKKRSECLLNPQEE